MVTGAREALRMPGGLVLTMLAHDWLFPLVCARVDCAAFFGVTLRIGHFIIQHYSHFGPLESRTPETMSARSAYIVWCTQHSYSDLFASREV
jgi:hypothetical protein